MHHQISDPEKENAYCAVRLHNTIDWEGQMFATSGLYYQNVE